MPSCTVGKVTTISAYLQRPSQAPRQFEQGKSFLSVGGPWGSVTGNSNFNSLIAVVASDIIYICLVQSQPRRPAHPSLPRNARRHAAVLQ